MIITYHYLNYFTFNISNIWFEIDSPLTLLQSKLKMYLEYIWNIIGGLILTKVRDRILIPGYCLFCENKEGRSSAHGNHFFHFNLSFTTAVTNLYYHDYKTLIISVVCTGLFISFCGDYQTLVCSIEACCWSGVFDSAV